MHRLGGWVVLHPRGPRSGPGYAVPVRHHLIGLIRPTRRHIAISPYTAYTPCLRCAGAPRRPASGSGLSLAILSWHAALNDPGELGHHHGPGLRCRHGLRRDLSGSALPLVPQSVSRGARISGLPGSLTLRPARLLAPLRRIGPGLPSPRGLLLPGFRRVGRPSCRWISLQQVLNSSVGGTCTRKNGS